MFAILIFFKNIFLPIENIIFPMFTIEMFQVIARFEEKKFCEAYK